MSVRVVAPCRLHFGLFHVPVDGLTHYPDGRPVRKFGGLGLMIENPCVTVEEWRAPTWRRHGNLADAASSLGSFIGGSSDFSSAASVHAFHADGPPEHIGLGVGTALGLAIGVAQRSLSFAWVGTACRTVNAVWVGRGQRSGIGVHGFDCGGFIADDGKTADEHPQLAARLDFPSAWRVVLVRPPTPPGVVRRPRADGVRPHPAR